MRAILPGGLRVDWTPDEVAEAMRILTQSMLDAARGREQSGLTVANPLLVRYEDCQVKLTPTEHALVRFAHSRGPSDFDDVRDAVWMKNVSDKRIANICGEITDKFLAAGIPYEVSGEGSLVSIKKI